MISIADFIPDVLPRYGCGKWQHPGCARAHPTSIRVPHGSAFSGHLITSWQASSKTHGKRKKDNQWSTLLASQRGRCAPCPTTPPLGGRAATPRRPSNRGPKPFVATPSQQRLPLLRWDVVGLTSIWFGASSGQERKRQVWECDWEGAH
jgi:hypothetical protein